MKDPSWKDALTLWTRAQSNIHPLTEKLLDFEKLLNNNKKISVLSG